MLPESATSTSPSSLFLLRGHKVQLLNSQTNTVLSETQLSSNPDLFELKGHCSVNKQHYVVSCSSEYVVLNLKGEVIIREAEKGLCKAKFLEHSPDYFFKVVKQNTSYIVTLSKFTGDSLSKVSEFEATFFKTNYEYIRFDGNGKLFGIQKKPTEVELMIEVNGKLQQMHVIKSQTQILEFYVKTGWVYLVTDDLKDGKPTVAVLVYRTMPSPVLDCKRVFNNVQEAKLHVTDDGSICLVNAHRYMDTTGSSYYGFEKVFFYNQNTKVFDEVVTYKGNIHDVKISPCQKYFIVVSGSVPSMSVLYDSKNTPVFMLSHDFRNSVFFAPNGVFVAIAGFGSLSGEIEIWNYQKREFIGSCKSNIASFLKWSPDSAYFMTATVVDKLKVDHRLSVFSYNGTLIKRIDFDVCNLIGVDFGYYRPTDQTIIDKPQKRAREAGSLIKNKMEPQKIDEYRIKNYIPGEPQIVKTPTTKPTLSVGGTITNSGSSGGGLFFNSKKDGEPNKFKARKD